MAQREVNGKTILLFIDPLGGTAYDMIICLTSNGLTISTDTINSSSKCGTSSSSGTSTNNVTFEGNYMIAPDAGRISAAGLFTLAKNKTDFSWKMGPATPISGDVVYNSIGFISALSITYPEGVATFSGTISSDDIIQVTTA